MKRVDFRATDALRPISITPGFMGNAHGSCLIEWGRTRVLCSCMLQEGVPPFLEGRGTGWLTAEYAMLPGSTFSRKQREGLKPDGRSTEIKRLIGRSLRCCVDFTALGENTLYIDCDVIEADGGTRTASITGAFVAFALAAEKLLNGGVLKRSPVLNYVAAVSCGFVENIPLLDLCYAEDSQAQADMNLVMTGSGEIVDISCTGEKRAIAVAELNQLIAMAKEGISQVIQIQKEVLSATDILAGSKK